MGLAASPEAYARLAAAGLLLALAAWLLYLNLTGRPNRTFALFLALAGGGYATYTVATHGADAGTQAYFYRVHPYFTLPLVFVVARFASVYPARRTWLARSPLGGFLLLTGGLGAVAAYAAQHDWFWRVARDAEGRAFVTDYGPLYYLVNAGLFLAYAAVALLFARDFTRLPSGPLRRSVRLICLGVTLYLLWLGTDRLLDALGDPRSFDGVPLVLVPVLLLVGHVSLRARTSDDAELRRLTARFLRILPAPIVTAVLAHVVPEIRLGGFVLETFPLLDGLWIMAFPVLVAYALLAHQLFDIDLRIRWTIRSGTIGVAFLAVFFFVGQLAENGFGLLFGWAYGSLAAALLLLALAPLQRVAERMAHWAMPTASGTREYLAFKRLEVYQAALEGLWHDGEVTPKERHALDQLREKLGIAPADAQMLERDVRDAFRQRGIAGAA